jgi:hypothetical protein
VNVFAGEENDVLDRMIKACEYAKGEVIVRVIGESILIDPSIIDEMVKFHISQNLDVTFAKGFPIGVAPEVINLSVLKRIQAFYKRVHPIKFIKDYPEFFKIGFFEAKAPFDREDLKLSILTKEDLLMIRDIFRQFYKNGEIVQLIRYIEEEYDLPFINKIERSLKEFDLNGIKRILIMRSTRIRWVNYALRACKRLFKDSKITLLTQNRTLNELKENPLVDEVIPYGDGFFNLFDLRSNLLDELKNKRFDLFLIMYNNMGGEGYQFIETLAYIINPRQVLSLNPMGDLFLLFKGYEDSSQQSHMIFMDINSIIDKSLDLTKKIKEADKNFSLTILSHPSWISDEVFFSLKDYTCLEIYTRIDPEPEFRSKQSVERWDALLSRGERIWGIATDDTHSLLHQGCKAWIMVRTQNFTYSGILSAIKHGSFYSSTGIESLEISLKDSVIQIELKFPARITFIGEGGRILKEIINSNHSSYAIKGDEKYIRIEVTEGEKKAWLQPFILSKEGIYNPYLERGFWFKGNTHTHTKKSDGESDLQEIIEFYLKNGYHFLTITDHERITDF